MTGPEGTEHPLYLENNCPACGSKAGVHNTSTPQGQQPVIICHMCGTRTLGRYIFDEGLSRLVTGMEFPKEQERA